jgi:hypothetical protein
LEELVASDYKPTINFETARALAEKAAREELSGLFDERVESILDEQFMEAECCWLFFRKAEIIVPKGGFKGWSFAISKRADVRLFYDFRHEPETMAEIFQNLSNHIKETIVRNVFRF